MTQTPAPPPTIAAALATLITATVAPAQPAPDKAGDSLFNPTPHELRRPLSADRPDATESPYTVDAGAIQIEASLAELTLNDEDGDTATTLSVAPINLKLGITDRIDLQLLFNPYERSEGPGGGAESGLGNLGVRAKINLWGNDSGGTALALLPYAVFPTGDSAVSEDAYRIGLVVPFAVELAGGWSLGTQAEIALTSPDEGDETASFSHTLALGRGLFGDLAGYVEYIGSYEFKGDPEYHPTASAGLTYAIDGDTQLDAGVRIGLDNGDTDDLVLFTGITKRF